MEASDFFTVIGILCCCCCILCSLSSLIQNMYNIMKFNQTVSQATVQPIAPPKSEP
jgi:hypothetical protein